ncbi:hypothetical protein [Stakelama pacifica]|uniref:Uncharacterized protein n=1 Tax=Stakelama pacifica TaxID=517720 RepID=A0A4R6FDJ6_9SPHN|nr:hypothetical protein [Stakelama pacifica]TDN79223.1 hypothetical protein EV664_1131 [Stakelama pacifica]GGO98690.1 hypothetical protein GCM10011329_30460 [Stakelama pacifica]
MPNARSTAKPAAFYRRTRTALLGLSVFTTGAILAGGVALWRRARRPSEGHAAPDLTGDRHPDGSTRAPADFRPDPTAKVTKADREALRPATRPSPGFDHRSEELNGTTTH